MADDDDKPESGDDPWAGLGGEESPDLAGGFSFSFDDEPAASPEVEPIAADAADATADADPFAEAISAGGSDDPFADAIAAGSADEPFAAAGEPAADDAAIDDWLTGGDDAAAAAAAISAAGGIDDEPAEAAEGEEIDFAAGGSGVEIGTGTSGIVSASGIDAFGSGGEAADPFAAFGDDVAAEADPAFTPESSSADDNAAEADPFATMGVAGTAAAAAAVGGATTGKRSGKGGKRSPPRRKQPSMIGQLLGVILGGAMAIPITFAILIWGFGKDPFDIAPMLPDSVAFLLPAKFRNGGVVPPDAIDVAGLPSIDDAIAGPPGGGLPTPDAADAGATEPAAEPVIPAEPSPTDVAAVDPPTTADVADAGEDPLMKLLDEGPAKEPPPPPEPEPLDLTDLEAAINAAGAALEAVAAVDDPADPVRRKLLAKWYKSLAKYAEELAALESQAAETGRPFGPAAERAAAIRGGLADHPQLLESLGVLARDWIAYAKRPSDGLVMPGTFVAARRLGPYWRSQIALPETDRKPATEMTVLTRAEPAVAPGDAVVVTGLAVDGDTVWAVEVRAAAADTTAVPGL